jgi:tetratricopeptide (TPR) repeat protein
LASDKGPLAGHSLFTGALIDGVESGSADLDGDGIITSSELGLYLQQQVGRATASAQTPDYGSFYLDDRGEMLLPLGEASPVKPAVAQQATERGPRVSAAFLGFENLSRKPEHEWISTALSEMLRTDIGAGDAIRTISGEAVARAKKDLSISSNDSLSRETLSSVYQVLGSDLIISGGYLNVGGTIRIDVRVQNALQGETVASLSESGAESDFLSVVDRLGKALREKCGAGTLTPAQATAVRGSQPGNPDAIRYYSEALDQLRVFSYVRGRELLEKAVAADSGNPVLRATLAQVLLELGEDSKAAEEAKRAFDLSHGLDRREGLLIEAQFRQANREWERAVAVYQSLWTFFPDDVEYALKLSSAQISAGRTQEALTTLLAARKLPRPQRDDPRIDLAEANAANSVSDYRRQDQAAKTAFDKANRKGAHLLASQALLEQCQAQRRLGELPSAEKLGQQAADQFASAGDLKRQAESLTCAANAFLDQGNYASAREQHEKALSLARQVGAQADIAGALLNLGNVEAAQQKLEQSTQFYQQALAVSAAIGDQPDKLNVQINIGGNLMMEGDYTSAKKMFEQAIETAAILGDRTRATEARLNLATIFFVQGDLASCQRELETSSAVSRELGVKDLTAVSMRMSGDVFLARGDLQLAAKNYQDALALRTSIGEKGAVADSSVSLAILALENNKPAESQVLAANAVKEFADAGDDDQQLVALDVLIQALLAQNKLADAQQQIQRGKALHGQDLAGSLAFEITNSRSLAKTGDTARALEELDRIIDQSGRRQFSYYQLLARVARAEALAIAGAKEAKSTCEAVASEATQTGFTLLQRRALRACSEHGL